MAIFALPHSYGEERKDRTWSVFDKPQMEMGECFRVERDQMDAQYVRFAEDVDQGDALTVKTDLLSITAGASDGNIVAGTNKITFAAASTLATMISNGLWTNDSDLKEMRGYALLRAIDTAPTPDVVRRGIVTDFTATSFDVIWDTDDGRLDVALADATTSFTLTAPWLVEKAGATDVVVAYAQRASKSKEYALVLVDGVGYNKANAAVAAGAPLYPAGADGEVDDEAGGTQPEPPTSYALTVGTLADEVIWAKVKAFGISKVPFFPESFLRSHRRPGETPQFIST